MAIDFEGYIAENAVGLGKQVPSLFALTVVEGPEDLMQEVQIDCPFKIGDYVRYSLPHVKGAVSVVVEICYKKRKMKLRARNFKGMKNFRWCEWQSIKDGNWEKVSESIFKKYSDSIIHYTNKGEARCLKR